MIQDTAIKEMQADVKRLADDIDFVLRVLTDSEFTDEDREFYLGTRQAWKQVEQGKLTTYSEEEFKKRWGSP